MIEQQACQQTSFGGVAVRGAPSFRFGLRTLFGCVTGLSVLLAILPWAAVAVMTPLVAGIYLAARSRGAHSKAGLSLLLPLILFLVLIECACANLAYYTLGEIDSALYYMLIWINAMAALISFISVRVGALATLILAVLIIPYQAHLGLRWRLLDQEAAHLIEYLEQQKHQRGAYPMDLAGYRSLSGAIQSSVYDPARPWDVMYWPDQPSGYVVRYHIGTESTCHEYSPANGWSYYPD
jgi:hypothetical protein